jgi:S-methylmethionine-dependent homocysteine/selenocysteine methylase
MIMSKYKHRLPQLEGGLFLTDGGLETTLIFHEGVELPLFAAFDLLRDQAGREKLRQYFLPYIAAAREHGAGFVLESVTWRASPDWGAKLGYSAQALAAVNRDAIELLEQLRTEHETAAMPMVVSGCVGPRGDGYDPGQLMSAGKAQAYHAPQVAALTAAGADMIAAITMTNVNEAIGVARAARREAMPVAISFTVETDGRLPTGQTLQDAIDQVDQATSGAPAYYMINCAHPTHFAGALAEGAAWSARVRGLRANASRRSHAELNEAPDLDAGNPEELGGQYGDLLRRFPRINVLGGCCGTDHRHVHAIGRACARVVQRRAA